MKIEARAKINWTLDVLGQRPDGYHELDMLMQPVTLFDLVSIEPAESLTLVMKGTPAIPADDNNLALRAARALQQASGCTAGADITIEKHIPAGAGMGGGSADAAAVLYGLNILWQLGLSQERLEAIGLALGADVPFCLHGQLCRARGVGEGLTQLPAAPVVPLVILQNCEGLSTKEIFSGWHAQTTPLHPDTEAAQAALLHGDLSALKAAGGNSLQPVSEKRRPEITQAISALYAQGALYAAMTGSGSAVFGAFASEDAARSACTKLSLTSPVCVYCESCSDSFN